MARSPQHRAEELQQKLRFESREAVDDGYGNTVSGDFTARFSTRAKRQYLRGGESVIAARLEARQPVILVVRASSETRQINAEWRAVDERSGEVFAIREKPRLTDDRAWYEMLAESGVAA